MRLQYTYIITFIVGILTAMPSKASIKLRMASFDVMNMEEGDAYMPWTSRSTDICIKLHKLQADIIGLQDVDSLQLSDIAQGLPEYSVADEKVASGFTHQHTNPLLYNSKVLKLVDRGTFYIADTPDVPAKSWNSNHVSSIFWSIFQHIKTGESFMVANTQWDSIDDNYRQDASMLIKIQLSKMTNKTPIVMMGNFAKTSEDIFYNALRSRVFLLKDSWTNAKKVIGTSTVNNLKAPEEDTNAIIDFIFTTPEFTTRKMTIISTKSGEHFLSDHNIIVADMIM